MERPVPALGLIAVLAGLSLNLVFLYFAVDILPARRMSISLVVWLLCVAAILIYGVFWVPLQAAVAGHSFGALLAGMYGRSAASIIRYGLAPFALLVVFSQLLRASTFLLEIVFRGSGVNEGSFLLDPAIPYLIVAVLVLAGVSVDLRSFSLSSVWLSKVCIVALLGVLILHAHSILRGLQHPRFTRFVDLNLAASFGLLWFCPFLLVAASHLVGHNNKEGVERRRNWHQIAWLGIAFPFALSIWLCSEIELGSTLQSPQAHSLLSAFAGPPAVSAGKLLIFSLSLLIPLRLAPRLLLELFDIPLHSLRAGGLIGALCALVIAFDEPLSYASLPAVLMVGVGATLSGAWTAAHLATRLSRLRNLPMIAVTPFTPPGRSMRIGVTLAGVLLARSLASGTIPWENIFAAATRNDWGAVGFECLVALFSLRNLTDTGLDSPGFLNSAAAGAWLLCFVGSLTITAWAIWRKRLDASGSLPGPS